MSVVLFISFVSVLLRCFLIPCNGILRVTHLTDIWEKRCRLRLIHTHTERRRKSVTKVYSFIEQRHLGGGIYGLSPIGLTFIVTKENSLTD